MSAAKAAEKYPIIDMYMTRQLGVIGKNCTVADLAIMCDMHIGHDPVIVAHARNARVLRRPQIESTELADGIAIADDQAGRLARIFLVLGHFT